MSDEEDDEGDCFNEMHLAYEIPEGNLHHQIVYGDPTMDHRDILLNLHARQILGVTKLNTLDGKIIKVGHFYPDAYLEDLDPPPDTNYSIRIPASMLSDWPALETYTLAHLPPLSNILDAHLNLSPVLRYASDILYDASSNHANFIIFGELYVIKSEIFCEKNVLQEGWFDYDVDYDDENLKCAICLSGLAGGIVCSRNLCGHVFHKSCLFPWMEMNNTCPLCREVIVRAGCH